MRVLIDTTYARRAPFSGTAVYVERLADALSQVAGVELIDVANARRRLPAGGGIGSMRNLLVDRWWEGLELPRLARRHRADVVHHPLPARSAGVRQVITVHDLAFERLPDCFDRGFRLYAHHAHGAAARAAGAVICVSQTTAADVRELWGVPAERIVVARHGPGQLFDLPRSEAPRHFLYVGDAEPRKDLPTLLAAYAMYRQVAAAPAPLVLAGSASADGEGIEVIRHPTTEWLAALYASALALVHPSLYEGFGLTPLEAMRAGVPVLAARSPGVEEVCAGAALYAEPGETESFASHMVRLATQPGLRHDLSRRAKARAAEFSWRASAESHVEAYRIAARRTGPLPSEST
jgi:glycosyltransferase involved in cell wall biosynthesis